MAVHSLDLLQVVEAVMEAEEVESAEYDCHNFGLQALVCVCLAEGACTPQSNSRDSMEMGPE